MINYYLKDSKTLLLFSSRSKMGQLTYIFVCIFFAIVSSKNCDDLAILLYEDMACQPLTYSEGCPSSYSCNLKAENKCVFQGKLYNPGDHLPKNSIGFGCEFGCFCTGGGNNTEVACAQYGCTEWSGLPPSPGCYRKYNLEQCCSSGENCPPFNDTTKCVIDNVEYKAGERFVPKDSCHVCICQKGFSGKFEAPYCKRSGCDAQLRYHKEIQKGCSPVYVKHDGDGNKFCCPQPYWACPDGTEIIKSGGKKTNLTCKFGEKTLNVGDSFSKEITYVVAPLKIRCECKIPPLLTCFKD